MKILRMDGTTIVELSINTLREANLCGANLWGADLCGANLRRADLGGADLCGANLGEANLYEAILWGANLGEADLRGANLCGADLREANLRRADLREANLCEANLSPFSIVPLEGSFIAWKKTSTGVIKIKVPAKARRISSLVGRKCRASFVHVLSGPGCGGDSPTSMNKLKYDIGSIQYADSFNDDIRIECAAGIHFFMTKEEAEAW